MRYEYRFEKLLNIKEKEKGEALSAYQESVKKFEEVAEKLYQYLKKKEDLESYQLSKLQNGLPVQEIRHYQTFLSNVEQSILHYQDLVIKARNRMNLMQEKLVDKNIEVKKYEKMKNNDFDRFLAQVKYVEGKQMDEISIQLYMNRES